MGRFRPVENFVLPLASALMPIPSLAWVPVFILWFGLGNTVSILIVFYAAIFPMLLNAWSGVRSVNQLWLRAAGAMGANEHALFWKVIIPGASPFIITGLRQAFLRAWIAVVGAEMLAASDWGLGWVIYDAKEFLNADVMLAALVVIGADRLPVRAARVRRRWNEYGPALGHGADGEGLKFFRFPVALVSQSCGEFSRIDFGTNRPAGDCADCKRSVRPGTLAAWGGRLTGWLGGTHR